MRGTKEWSGREGVCWDEEVEVIGSLGMVNGIHPPCLHLLRLSKDINVQDSSIIYMQSKHLLYIA